MIKLIIDLGSYSIKYIFASDNEILTTGLIIHDCIVNGNIIDPNKLLHIIKKLIYELEVDYFLTINDIAISIDFCEFFTVKHSKQININGVITEHHLDSLSYSGENYPNLITIEKFYEKYLIDGCINVINPVNLRAKSVKYTAIFVFIPYSVKFQLQILSDNLKNLKIHVGFVEVIKHLNQSYKNYTFIDIGHYNTRFIEKYNKEWKINCYFNGMTYFHKHINKNLISLSDISFIDVNIHKDLLNKFFNNIIKCEYNDSIFVTGGAVYVPFLYEYLKQLFNWNVNNINLNQRISFKYNSDLFLKCFLIMKSK